jgi:DNA polymerase elongation subunit (family B)
MRNGEIELDKYIITKSLTKQPEDYPDGKNQHYIQVALRRKRNGHRISPSNTVPYIICIEVIYLESLSGCTTLLQSSCYKDQEVSS